MSSESARIIGLAALAASALIALPAAAQVTPSDVRDLIGARAASGESELASRGYVNVGRQTGADRKWTYWWNDRRGVCLTVATAEGHTTPWFQLRTPTASSVPIKGLRRPHLDMADLVGTTIASTLRSSAMARGTSSPPSRRPATNGTMTSGSMWLRAATNSHTKTTARL